MIITISGDACTGTTTLARNLSKALQIPCFLVGELFRDIAKEYNVDLMTMVGEKREEFQLDQLVDNKIQKLLKSPTSLIVEGRLSGYFAWKSNIISKRILLTADLETKVLRLIEREGENATKARQKILERDREDWERYEKLYGIRPEEQDEWYTLMISTSNKSITEVLEIARNHCAPISV